jgi:anti-sigma factor RsiW
MNGCDAVQAGFTEYLDGRLNGHAMQEIAAHLNDCRECARQWQSLRQTQA